MDEIDEKRKHPRYATEVKIHFYVPYDLQTKVNFQIMEREPEKNSGEKFVGLSKNISAGGLCFISEKKLQLGDVLALELYLPNAREAIPMQGEVRWCKSSFPGHDLEVQFETGVQLISVRDKAVEKTIYFDHTHQVIWSDVLESVLGSFSLLHKKVL